MVHGLQIFCEKNEPDFEKEQEELRTLWKNIDQTLVLAHTFNGEHATIRAGNR